MEIVVCHLYPDLLNLYGDAGNIKSIIKRCQWRGITTSLYNISIGDLFDADKYDIIFLGGGQDFEQEVLSKDIKLEKAGELINAVKWGKTVIGICGGYQMLGRSYVNQIGKELEFIGAIDVYTLSGKKRMIGNTLYKTDIDGGFEISGFENHSGKTYLGSGVLPLAKVIKGAGNNNEDGGEGAVYMNTFCSYSHGPLLPKNPRLSDYMIKRTLEYKYKTHIELKPLDDDLENSAFEVSKRLSY